MIPARTTVRVAIVVVLASALAAEAQSPAAQPKSAAKTVSTTGIPYLPDNDQAGPPELLQAIRARRPNGQALEPRSHAAAQPGLRDRLEHDVRDHPQQALPRRQAARDGNHGHRSAQQGGLRM